MENILNRINCHEAPADIIKTDELTDICYVISHGFAARMLFQTGLIEKLAGLGLRIALITPAPEDNNLKDMQRNPNIRIYGVQSKENLWDEDYLFKRKYYLENIRLNPALWEKHVYSLWYSTSKHPWRRIRPMYYYLIYSMVWLFPGLRKRFLKNEHSYLYSKEIKELIEQIQPRTVVSTYPVNLLEARVLYAAAQQGILRIIHLLSWDNITSKGRFPVMADYYLAWGEVMKQELCSFYKMPEDKIYICGVPHFDHHLVVKNSPYFDILLTELDLQPGNPFLLVAMSSPRFAPKEIDIVEWLAHQVEKDVFGKDMQLVIRPHPQNVQGSMADIGALKRLEQLKSNRVGVSLPKLQKSNLRWSMQQNDMSDLSNLLVGCSVCLNSGSTVSIDALVVGKPVILTSFDGSYKLPYWKSARRLADYTHQKKFIDLGGAKVVNSLGELEKAIQGYLAEPGKDLVQRERALAQECYRNDGNATGRVVDAMVEILKKSSSTIHAI